MGGNFLQLNNRWVLRRVDFGNEVLKETASSQNSHYRKVMRETGHSVELLSDDNNFDLMEIDRLPVISKDSAKLFLHTVFNPLYAQ